MSNFNKKKAFNNKKKQNNNGYTVITNEDVKNLKNKNKKSLQLFNAIKKHIRDLKFSPDNKISLKNSMILEYKTNPKLFFIKILFNLIIFVKGLQIITYIQKKKVTLLKEEYLDIKNNKNFFNKTEQEKELILDNIVNNYKTNNILPNNNNNKI